MHINYEFRQVMYYQQCDVDKHFMPVNLDYSVVSDADANISAVKAIQSHYSEHVSAVCTQFDRQRSRTICIGNSETCQRLTNQGVEHHPCPSPDLCRLAQGELCKPYGKLYMNLDELDELDEFGTFVFRTVSFNSTVARWS